MNKNLTMPIKYRPQTIDDVWGNDMTKNDLRHYLAINKLPHLMVFSGNVGVGKTSMAYCLDKALSCENKNEHLPCGVCEHCKAIEESLFQKGEGVPQMGIYKFEMGSKNADEYVQLALRLLDAPVYGNQTIIIHLDELQILPKTQQDKLNDKIEFALANADCNKYVFITTSNKNNIHPGIISRARVFYAERPDNEAMVEGALQICKRETIPITKEKLKKLVMTSESPRDLVNYLEDIKNGTPDTYNRIVGAGTDNINNYIEYFDAVKMGLNRIITYIDRECNSPQDLLMGMSEFIMNYIRKNNDRDYIISKDLSKKLDEVMSTFKTETLFKVMIELETLPSYIDILSAKRKLIIYAYTFNVSLFIQEKQDDNTNNVKSVDVDNINDKKSPPKAVQRTSDTQELNKLINIATSVMSIEDL